jgi:hypothetical protein
MISELFWIFLWVDPRDSASGTGDSAYILLFFPVIIPYLLFYYRSSGMEKCVIPRKADIIVLEQRLEIAERNLTRAEKGQDLIVLSALIMLLSTIYFVIDPEHYDYDSFLGLMGLPLSGATVITLTLTRLFDENLEQKKVDQIKKRIQKIKSEKRSSEKRKRVATEKAEYKTKQLEKAINLKDKGGIENLEKALEILKNYE